MKTKPLACAALMVVLLVMVVHSPTSGASTGRVVEPIPLPVWESEILAIGVHIHTLGAPALALDPAGRPHIVFGSNALFHAWFDGVVWQREIVDDLRSTISEAVLAIDGAGRIHIADIDQGRASIRSRTTGGTWQVTQLPLPTEVSELSIALDRHGQPYVVAGYDAYKEKQEFFLVREDTTGWKVEAVATASATGGPLRLAIDDAGQPVVLYAQANQGELWMARRAAGWQHEKVAEGCLLIGKSLALDSLGNAHAAYSDNCDHQLTYAREGESGWKLMPVADDGLFPSLALDGGGRPHIAYKDQEGGQMIAALTGGIYWDVSRVQAGEDAGWHNTLVLDEVGTAHIASVKDGLYYATNPAGVWQVMRVAENRWMGQINALGLDSADTPYVLYNDAPGNELWWGIGQGDKWTTGLLAEVEPGGLEVALAVDSADIPHIAYVDRVADRLVAGYRKGDEWVLETIGKGGIGLSLAVGSDDKPQIILTVEGGVTYWTQEGGEWVSEPVGSLSHSGYGAYLALDSQNRPHIAGYLDNEVWQAVRLSPGDWSMEPLGVENVLGLALGPQDQLYILHRTSEPWRKLPPASIETLWLAVQVDQSTWDNYVIAGGIEWWDITAQVLVSDDQRAHVALTNQVGEAVYHWIDPDGTWGQEYVGWSNMGDIRIGSDGQPRLLSNDFSNLILSTRRIVWLDQAAYLPVLPR